MCGLDGRRGRGKIGRRRKEGSCFGDRESEKGEGAFISCPFFEFFFPVRSMLVEAGGNYRSSSLLQGSLSPPFPFFSHNTIAELRREERVQL